MIHRFLVVVATFAVSCASSSSGSSASTSESVSPSDAATRTVTIRTTACGDASRTTGSGVIVADDLVVTAAHVVVGATDVFVRAGESEESAGVVLAIDTADDLALVGFDADETFGPVELADLSAGEAATLVGGASSGDVDVVVSRRADISVEEVRGSAVVVRDGYELRGAIAGGDSGAGIFTTGGELGAIVFAEPSASRSSEPDDSDRFFATASTAVESLVELAERRPHVCDRSASRLVPLDGD